MKRKHTPSSAKVRRKDNLVGQAGNANSRTAARPKPFRYWRVAFLMGVVAISGVWWVVQRRNGTDPKAGPVSPVPVVAAKSGGMPSTNDGAASAPLLPPASTNSNANESGSLVEKINRANELLSKGNATQAVDVLTTAAQLSPEDEDVHYNLGIALSRVGKNQQAIREYEEALRILPDYAEAHNNLGNLLARLGRTDDAIKHFEEAVKITPDYASAWNNFGNALQQQGQTNEARAKFQKAVEVDPKYWQAHYNLGASYQQQQRFADARAEFETVQRLEPSFALVKSALERLNRQEAGLGPLRPPHATNAPAVASPSSQADLKSE